MSSTTDVLRALTDQRTVIDHRLAWRQRDEVERIITDLSNEVRAAGRAPFAAVFSDLAPLVVTARDAVTVATLFDSLGHSASSSGTRAALYAAALRLRQLVEV